jgi:hypothetical protein
MCQVQAFLINFSILSSFFFTSIILHFLHWCIVQRKMQTKKLEVYYMLLAWGLPFILSFVPITTNSYQPSNGWCWIDGQNHYEVIALQLVEGFGTFTIILLYNIVTLIKIKKKLQQDITEHSGYERLRVKLIRRMIYYPILLLICVLPAAIHRVYLYITSTELPTFTIIAAVFQCLLGFGNCLVYGCTDSLRNRIKKRLNLAIEPDETTSFVDK